MPSPALSPQQNVNMVAMPGSPRQASGGGARPPIMKRHSSQSSHGGARGVLSPGSAGEHHPLRHAVGGRQRHAKIVLPRNHSSGRNLAKMGRQAAAAGQHVQYAEDGKKHARQRSHEGDSEIRLPGSLDESRPVLKRNMTAHDLPRNKSGTKLKKNLSHGQLTRLASGKNLAAMGFTQKAPPSPGLKGRKGRAKSEEIAREKDLHEQEVELQRQMQERKASQEAGAPRRVGFAVGSAGDDSDDADAPQMEGSGLQEDEWTDNSASASPMSTRLNTASNSRRPSVAVDKPPDTEVTQPQHPNIRFHMTEVKQPKQPDQQAMPTTPEADGTPAQSEEELGEEQEEDEVDPPSPKSMPTAPPLKHEQPPEKPTSLEPQSQEPPPHIRSPLHAAKDHPNPAAKRLTSAQLPAPALVSSISALDDVHSTRASPAPSLRSTRSIVGNDGAADTDQVHELVSKFLPSTSHPSIGSGPNTGAMNTPKTGSFQAQTPEEDSMLHRARPTGATFHTGPVSPGSTRSASSGANTPALARSRVELKMMNEKALSDRAAAAERRPMVPPHIYDRRNETLKSYLNLVAMGEITDSTSLPLGPEIFQGRFKAVNTELKVVQKFRDPVAEAVKRLQMCRGSKLGQRRSPQKQAAQLKVSKSAVTLPSRGKPTHEPSKLSTSVSPPKATPPLGAQAKSDSPQKSSALPSSKSAVQIQGAEQRKPPRRGVSFAGAEPQMREYERANEDGGPDDIAKMLWDSVNA